jgi:hypothetical protein
LPSPSWNEGCLCIRIPSPIQRSSREGNALIFKAIKKILEGDKKGK